MDDLKDELQQLKERINMNYKLRVYTDYNGISRDESLLEEKELPERLFVGDWVLGTGYDAIVQTVVYNGVDIMVCNASVWKPAEEPIEKEVD